MTTEEQILENRAFAAIIHRRFRKAAQLIRASHSTWNFSLEWRTSGITHGCFPTPPPGAQTQFDLMVTALRTFAPGILVRMDCGSSIDPYTLDPDGVKTMTLFPMAGSGTPPSYPPPEDNVPPTDQLPEQCIPCGDKIYTA